MYEWETHQDMVLYGFHPSPPCPLLKHDHHTFGTPSGSPIRYSMRVWVSDSSCARPTVAIAMSIGRSSSVNGQRRKCFIAWPGGVAVARYILIRFCSGYNNKNINIPSKYYPFSAQRAHKKQAKSNSGQFMWRAENNSNIDYVNYFNTIKRLGDESKIWK